MNILFQYHQIKHFYIKYLKIILKNYQEFFFNFFILRKPTINYMKFLYKKKINDKKSYKINYNLNPNRIAYKKIHIKINY